MSAKTPPTDDSKDCNGLSIQKGWDTTPTAESGAATSPITAAPKKTSRSGRALKPTLKQKARIDGNNASASRVSRIIGNESLADKIARCDFDSIVSINEVFPCHKGKGTHDIPLELLSLSKTLQGKAKAVREWRLLSNQQQMGKINRILECQQREKQAAAKAVAEIDMSDGSEGGGRGKRKRKQQQQQQQQKQKQKQKQTEAAPPAKKKRQARKERTQAQKDESAKRKRDRDDRRNAKKREERKRRLQEDVSSSVIAHANAILCHHVTLTLLCYLLEHHWVSC